MKKLERHADLLLLANPPQSTAQQAIAESLGFRKSRSGDWIKRDELPATPLWVLEKYGQTHTCRACRDSFGSKTKRDPFCNSCRLIIQSKLQELTRLITESLHADEKIRRAAYDRVEKELTCTYPTGDNTHCGWDSNAGRKRVESFEELLNVLPQWVTTAHIHFLRHVFFNRFPFSKRFFPKLPPEKAEETYRYYYSREWKNKLKEAIGPILVEITYPPEDDSAGGSGQEN